MPTLELIFGPMFAGKSTELIRHIRLLKVLNKNYVVIKPKIDVRYKDNMVVSHSNEKTDCIVLNKMNDIYNIISQIDFVSIDTIFIDEGQFFDDLKIVVIELVEKHNKNVIVAGLDGDSNRNKFGQILDLIPYCDKLTKLNALCLKCMDGTPGIFSHRDINCMNQVLIGGSNEYSSMCRKHYLE